MKQWLHSLPWKQWKRGITKFWDKSGFAVVLLACAGVIGLSMLYESAPGEETPVEPTPIATLRPIAAVSPPVYEPAAAATPAPALLSLPLLGGEGAGYAPDQLIYSQTMGEWTTHDGIDLFAPAGTQVSAAAAGVVVDAFEDPVWGNVVVIDHGGGMMTGYASLGTILVSRDDAVKGGQRIGIVGNSALIEYDEGAHIHFYVIVDGKTVNPLDYLQR